MHRSKVVNFEFCVKLKFFLEIKWLRLHGRAKKTGSILLFTILLFYLEIGAGPF